ncbi:hypothetical protein RUM44_013855 [Polyplax serrata]|uniref:Protein kinase domain-containing protein n=1 Tax=Polyplax serrata TaxID=468196 RepID=A0ABR1BJF6_POLSC
MFTSAGFGHLEQTNPSAKLKVRNLVTLKLCKSEELLKHYELGKVIGQGCFGVVHEAVKKQDNKPWAIKIMHKSKAGQSRLQQLQREINILKSVRHDHIIHLEQLFETPNKYFLVMEKCHGELYDVFIKEKRLAENETRTVVTRLADAVAYLHKSDIVHRDIKLENILMGTNPQDPNDHLYIKLTDFGLSAVKGNGVENMLNDCCGSLQYMAPEIIENRPYSQQCDVWSIGVLDFLLLCGFWPFYSENQCEQEVCHLILTEEPNYSGWEWQNISKPAIHLLQKMLNKNPAFRITAAEILNHPWIKGEAKLEGQSGTQNILELMKIWNTESKRDSHENCSNTSSGACDTGNEKCVN